MLKYIFGFFIFVHGLIHFMGFAKAFNYGNITALTKEIAKPAGVAWLVAAFLFAAAAILFLFKKDSWSIIAVVAVILSQLMIITSWRDAKFGTIANIIIVLAAVPAMAAMYFNTMVNKEVQTMFARVAYTSNYVITNDRLTDLPPVVKKWLTHSGVVGKQSINIIRLKQKGLLKLKPDAKWIPFKACEYFTVEDPAFVWKAEVSMMPLITLYARDMLKDGEGALLIKAVALVPVAKGSNSDKINSATVIRYLSEICWFPAAALSNYIKWETVDSRSAKATMSYKGHTVSGIFTFNEAGDLISFMANRYYGSGEDATLEKWLITVTGYKEFSGIRIPYKNTVTWKLKTGDFTWADIEVTEMEFNKPVLYQ